MSATSSKPFLENAPFSSVPEPTEFGSDLYYVVQKNSGYVVHGSLERVVEEYCGACAYYPYSLDGKVHDDYDQHEHFFGDLLKVVLEHPRSFSIPEELRSYYSEQQLAIIDAFQQTLLKEHDATQSELAEAFAQRVHFGQYDKAGHPYIYHPAYVAEMADSDEAQAVAWLHDVVEDTGATLDELREAGFSEAVVAGVDAMTRREGEDYLDFVRRAKANPLAREVKTYDILHNMDLERVVDLDNKVPADALARVRDKYLPALEILMSDDD